jgi:hypothetical protein
MSDKNKFKPIEAILIQSCIQTKAQQMEKNILV